MNNVKLGIIGAGGIAEGIHLPVLSRLENVKLTAVCDLRAERAERMAELYGIPSSYTSYHEMLEEEELDAVFVLTQPDALFRAANDCLRFGLHVFMEKPLGITAYQARTLRDSAVAQGCVLHAGFNRRYIPLVREALRIVRETAEITLAEGRFYKNSSPAFYDGCSNAFMCDVVHCVDLVRHVAGEGVTSSALLESREESWHALMRFEGGAAGVVRSHYATGGRVHEFEFHGPGVSAYIDLGFGGPGCSAKILRALSPGRQSISAMGAGDTEVIELDGMALAGSERYEDYYGYRDGDAAFIRAVLNGGPDLPRMNEDVATMELMERLLQSRI